MDDLGTLINHLNFTERSATQGWHITVANVLGPSSALLQLFLSKFSNLLNNDTPH